MGTPGASGREIGSAIAPPSVLPVPRTAMENTDSTQMTQQKSKLPKTETSGIIGH
jgi:hypothetical protein